MILISYLYRQVISYLFDNPTSNTNVIYGFPQSVGWLLRHHANTVSIKLYIRH